MNKNTLIAFLLIAIVLIATPYYLELVSPPPPPQIDDTAERTTPTEPPPQQQIAETAETYRRTELNEAQLSDYEIPFAENRIIQIENDLFTASLSTQNGGSFYDYTLKHYYTNDSTNVRLIDKLNKNNLLIEFISLSGDFIVLDNDWHYDGATDVLNATHESKTLRFSTTILGETITKTFIFNPGTYQIEVSLDLSGLEDALSQGLFTLSWLGGLPTTEVNKKDDLFYFRGYAYQGGELHDPKIKRNSGSNSQKIIGNTDWIATRSKYFISAIIPTIPAVGAEIGGLTVNDVPRYDLALQNDVRSSKSFKLYLGPLEYNRIKALNINLDRSMNLGWKPIRPISLGVLALLKAMYKYIPNYGVVLIIFSILIKILVYPLTKKSHTSTAKMQQVQPQLAALKEKHKNNPQKLNKATMAFYKEQGVNPMGGCLPLLIQMPLLIALFTVFRTTIELRGAPFFLWIKDLSAPDTLFTIGEFPINILPLLMAATMLLQQKMTPSPAMGQQKAMPYIMNIMFLFIFYRFPSGLNLYYTLFNLLTVIQQKYLTPAPVSATAPSGKPDKNK
jgi:YidC/Oxa1 family membrane protein insertase